MSVAPVNGQEITRSNAYNFYYGHYHNKYQLTEEQLERCEEFLTQDQIEYCQKDSGDFRKDGMDAIDKEGMGDKSEERTVGDKIVNGAGMSASVISAGAILAAILLDGFGQLAIAIIVAAGAATNLVSAIMMDSSLDERDKQSSLTEANKQAIQDKDQKVTEITNEILANNQRYIDSQNQKTAMVTDATNNRALQEVELHDAQAAGDDSRAQELSQALKDNEGGPDTSAQDEVMEECRQKCDEGQAAAEEASGTTEAGTSVAKFLQEGKVFADLAKYQSTINTALCTAATTAGLGAFPKWLCDTVPSGAAKILLIAAGLVFGGAAALYSSKQGKETTCATNGDATNELCKTTNESIDTLTNEMNNALSLYGQSDEDAAKTKVATEESAEASTDENNGTHPTVTVTQEPEVEEEPQDLVL